MRRERPGCDKGEWHWLTSASKARGGQQGGGEGGGGWLLWRPGQGISIRAECIILVPVRAVDISGQNGSIAAFWTSAAFDQRMVIYLL